MTESKRNSGAPEGTTGHPQGQELPEVYSVSRGLSGWTLSRRSLLTAAAAAAAAAALPKRAPAAVCGANALAHIGAVSTVAINRDGGLLASASGLDGTVKLWSLPNGALVHSLSGGYDTPSVAISPDGKILVSSSRTPVKIWSLPGGTLLNTLTNAWAMTVAISPDSQVLVTVDDTGTMLWSLPAGNLLQTLDTDWAAAAAFSPNGQMLVTGLWNGGSINLWSLPGGQLLNTLTGHSNGVWSVAIGPDGRLLASGSYDTTIKLWALPGGALLETLTGHTAPVRGIAISPDGRLLASSSDDQTIKLWSLPGGALLRSLSAWAGSVAFSPDGVLLVSGGGEGSIRLWSVPDFKQLPVCLMDLASSPYSSATQYTMAGSAYVVPCGTPLPTGAVITCNCVPGCSCVSDSGGGCGTVCICVPVY